MFRVLFSAIGNAGKRSKKFVFGRKSAIWRTAIAVLGINGLRSPYLRDFCNRLKSKRGTGKAIIATARRLLNKVFYTLKHGRVFEDFSNFELKGCN